MLQKLILGLFVCCALLWSSSSHAHSQLVQSSPSDGQRLQSPPAALHLQYNEPVRLLNLELVGTDQGVIDINFQRTRQQNDHYHLDLPTLANDAYTITWTLIGQDGHRVTGTIEFSIVE